MMRLTKVVFLSFLVALILFPGGCNTPPGTVADTTGSITFWVTLDFGRESLFHAELPVTSNQSVLALLQKHLDVETEYGGGFVNAINGFRSGYSNKTGKESQMVDWFYYVNGILSDQGAANYVPGAGDVIWWDYRPWDNIALAPAVVGAFPQPFTNGYRGEKPATLMLAGKDCQEKAKQLAYFLEEMGAAPVELAAYEEKRAAKRTQIVLVVALWQNLHQDPLWEEIQKYRGRTGWFAELTAGRFYPLDQYGNRQGKGYQEKTGAVLATGAGLGDPHPLWVVTATDLEGLEKTVNALIKDPQLFEKTTGALVVDGKVLNLPLKGDIQD